MTERENMQLVWDHKQPEWVPAIVKASQMLITPEINDRPLFMDGTDWFGLDWRIDPKNPNLMTHLKPGQCLFNDISDWRKHFSFPSVKDLNWEMIGQRTKAMWKKKDELMGYCVGNMGGFERLCAAMNHENGLTAFCLDIDACTDFMEAYAGYRIEQFGYIKKYMDPDFMMMHDDWGNQNNMFISPEMWRASCKEPVRRMAKACHDLGMYYMHHSCGYIEPIIGDLAEIGVDSWHGGAPSNNLAKIKAEHGDKLIFAGCVDPQVTDAPGVTEEDVRADVRRAIDVLGKNGGLMISSAVMFSIMPGVDNIIIDECTKYGKYN